MSHNSRKRVNTGGTKDWHVERRCSALVKKGLLLKEDNTCGSSESVESAVEPGQGSMEGGLIQTREGLNGPMPHRRDLEPGSFQHAPM